jgi:hypothetical protein
MKEIKDVKTWTEIKDDVYGKKGTQKKRSA